MIRIHRGPCALSVIVAVVALAAPTAESAPSAAPYEAGPSTQKPSLTHKPIHVRTLSRDGRFRRDFTLQLGLGVGYQSGDLGSQQLGELALAGVDFAIGGFVQPWTSLFFRVTGTFAFPSDDFYDRFSFTGIYGGSAQFWLADWLKIETGLGLATHWIRTIERTRKRADFGVGFITGLYVPIFQRREHSLQLGVGYMPIIVRDSVFQTSLFTLSWQYL